MDFPFVKMNGLGNDFVVVLAGDLPFDPGPEQARAIADRDEGIGCDQLIAVTHSDRAHARMRIWNADGGEVEACGNAARCVGWLLLEAGTLGEARLETAAGVIEASRAGDHMVTVDMGAPRFDWRDIPMARPDDTRELGIEVSPMLKGPGAVSMGNPHVVFFAADLDTVPIRQVGPLIERHPLFPQRTNVGFAQVLGPELIRLKVWERGVGLTRACGTGACAALVAGHRRGLVDRRAVVQLDGGELLIDWSAEDGHVRMTGPVSVEFTGRLPSLETLA